MSLNDMNKMSGKISEKNSKILCAASGNRCAMPDCRNVLIVPGNERDDASFVAEIAHIKGEKPNSARYDADQTDTERNSHSNLILVCPSCHKKIDDQPNTYTVKKLLEIKTSHEKWITESTRQEIPNVTFAELSVVTKYVVSGQASPSDSFALIPPKDKIKKNGLSQSIEQLIVIGMAQVKQVSNFIEKSPDGEFGARLTQGFVAKYESLKNDKIEGDDLFNSLLGFASAGASDFIQIAAGLAVLVYLFEKCEVFEK
jgi:hypothetical protein